MAIDINLLGKRYVELTPTGTILDNSLIAAYKIGDPELNSLTFLQFQANIELKKLKDLQNQVLIENGFIRWNTAEDKFIIGVLSASEIPNLDASKITTGIFDVARIPNLPISSITGLQGELDSKEGSFLKGDIFSSTLILTNNTQRLYGVENFTIEVDIASIVDEVTSTINFYWTDFFTYTVSNVFTLTHIPTRLEVFVFDEGAELGQLLEPPFYTVNNNELTILTTLVANQRLLVKYFYDDALYPNVAANLQDVTNNGNVTNRTLIHAPAVFPNESVTLQQLTDAILSVNAGLPDGLLEGGIVLWTGTGYNYIVTRALIREIGVLYYVPGELIPSFEFTISPGDATFDRKDTVVVSSAGFEVLEGLPSADPVEPQPTGFQIRLTVIDVPALSIVPPSTSLIDVYRENLEYIVTHSGAGNSDPDSTLNPFEGAKSVNVSAVENGSTTLFTAPVDVSFASIDSATLRISLKEAFSGGHNVGIQFFDEFDVAVSNTLVLTINKALINSYQFVAFAINQFTPTAPDFRKIAFRFIRNGNQASRLGYFIDNFILQGGVVQPPITSFNLTLTNEVSGTGPIENPVNVALTEKAISNRIEKLEAEDDDEFLIRTALGQLRRVQKQNLGINFVQTVEQKFTWLSGPTTFTLTEIPDSVPFVFLNTLLLDRTFWVLLGDELTITEVIPVDSKIVVYYYQNVTGSGIKEAPINGTYYVRRNGEWIESTDGQGFEAEIRESNTVLFDKRYYTGNTVPRSGNVLFSFVNAKLGMWTQMLHQDPAAFTFDDNGGTIDIQLNFDIADVSDTLVNKFLYVLSKKDTGAERVEIFLAREGGL